LKEVFEKIKSKIKFGENKDDIVYNYFVFDENEGFE
jgi:hypothetical protein